MNLSLADIKKIGALARLKLTESEAAKYRSDLGGILRYVDQLAKAPFKKGAIKDVSQAFGHFREDGVEVWAHDERESALGKNIQTSDRQLKVKRILA